MAEDGVRARAQAPNRPQRLSNQAAPGHDHVFMGQWSATDQTKSLVVRHHPFLSDRLLGERYRLIETLRTVDPRLKRLTTIFSAGFPMIWGDIGLGRMIPLPLMGDGLGRLTSLILAIANARDGAVLVDEVENGLHHSILQKVWLAIADASRRFNTQIFATTHSFDCIRAAHEAFENDGSDDFGLHRLDRIEGRILSVTYDEEALAAAMKTALEVR